MRENEASKAKEFEKGAKPWPPSKTTHVEVVTDAEPKVQRSAGSPPGGLGGRPQAQTEGGRVPQQVHAAPADQREDQDGGIGSGGNYFSAGTLQEVRKLRRVYAAAALLSNQQHFSEDEVRKALGVVREGCA